jgi:hypothetical protein
VGDDLEWVQQHSVAHSVLPSSCLHCLDVPTTSLGGHGSDRAIQNDLEVDEQYRVNTP